VRAGFGKHIKPVEGLRSARVIACDAYAALISPMPKMLIGPFVSSYSAGIV